MTMQQFEYTASIRSLNETKKIHNEGWFRVGTLHAFLLFPIKSVPSYYEQFYENFP